MKYRVIQGILTLFVVYIAMCVIGLSSIANFGLAVFLVAIIPMSIFFMIYQNQVFKYSIKIVPTAFVVNQNTIKNDHCTVMYAPDEKIIVMDNEPDKRRAKRMFTLKKGKVNINKAWNRVCRIYDSFITLDSLASFYSYDTKIDIITLEAKIPTPAAKKSVNIDASNSGPKFVDMNNIQADPYSKGTENPNAAGAAFVDMSNIQEQKTFTKREEQAPEFHEFDAIMSNSSKKIDVNNVTASELAILPGINIVIAKKIIEYRDANGLFKTFDDFIKVADVKEHFVDKIKDMVIFGEAPKQSEDDDYSEGRIVDF